MTTNENLYRRIASNVFPTRDGASGVKREDSILAIETFRQEAKKEAREEFEEAIYKHIDSISEESKEFKDDMFRSVGFSLRISAIRETLNILATLNQQTKD